jgi:ribokinase
MSVTGIGQCSWDYLSVVRSYPEPDTKEEVLGLEEQGGGPVATALVALGRLGVGCRFFGVTGDDAEGRKIRQSLIDDGVETGGIVIRENARSQVAFIVIEKEGGRRTIFWQRPSGEPLRPKELEEEFLKGSRFLLLDGLMKDASLHAAGRARSLGVPVMLDAGRVREGMLDIARLSDYVVASSEFARELGYKDDPEDFFEKTKDLVPGVFTVTLGERGSVTCAGGEVITVPAFRVEAVDTTGAGDVFHGGYIYGLLQGWELRKTIRFASAMAALKCRNIGGRAGIPTLEEALRLMEES